MKVKNAKQLPKLFFGLHFFPGVAEYREEGKDPFRIFVNESTIKKMDPTFQGCPVYVHHVPEVDVADIQEADGYVVRSFFNEADGNTWCEFLVVSDRGHEAIAKGWKLSNAYIPKAFGGGGLWHGVEYLKEVTSAEYEHLAIVPNPRYSESIILSPEQFKQYCSDKKTEIEKLSNSSDSKEKGESMLSFFKKAKVDNSAELESTVVTLPKSKKDISLLQLVNDMDDKEMAEKDDNVMANLGHKVRIGKNQMTVNDLIGKHMAMCQEFEDLKKKLDPAEESEEKMKKDADPTEKKENEEVDPKEKKENDEADKKDEKLKNAKENFKKLENAPKVGNQGPKEIHVPCDPAALGKQRYGSAVSK